MADLAKMPTLEELGLGSRVGSPGVVPRVDTSRNTQAIKNAAANLVQGAAGLTAAASPSALLTRGALAAGSAVGGSAPVQGFRNKVIADSTYTNSQPPAAAMGWNRGKWSPNQPVYGMPVNAPAPAQAPTQAPGRLGPAAPFVATGMTRSPATQAPAAMENAPQPASPAGVSYRGADGARGSIVLTGTPATTSGVGRGVAQTSLIRDAAGKIIGERPTGRMVSFDDIAQYAVAPPPASSATMPSMRGGGSPRTTAGLRFGKDGNVESYERPMSVAEITAAEKTQADARLAGAQADYFGPTAALGMRKTAAEIAQIGPEGESTRALRAAQAAAAPVVAEAKTTAAEAAATKAEATAAGRGPIVRQAKREADFETGLPATDYITTIQNGKEVTIDQYDLLPEADTQAANTLAFKSLTPAQQEWARANRSKTPSASAERDLLARARRIKK